MENIEAGNLSENKKKKSRKKIIILIILILLFLAGFFFVFKKITENREKAEKENTEEAGNEDENFKKSNIEDVLGKNEGDSSDQGGIQSGVSASENYKISQVRFGGNIALEDEQQKDLAIELYDIKSEMVSSRENEEPKFLLTWKSNKATLSSVSYARDDGSNLQEFKEESYGFEHSALLSDIELSTIYVYKIKARDRWGNEKSSEFFSMYTGEKNASIFDLIVSSIEDIFSWAIKK